MPALLLKFWPQLAAAALLIAAALWFSHARFHAGYEAAQAAMAEAVRKAELATKAAEANARAITEAKDREWQTQRDQLQSRVTDLLARPAPAIRMCKPSRSRDVPAVPEAAGEPDASAAAGEPAVQVGGDLRPRLVVYGGDCERVTRQLSELQAWIQAQAR